MAQTRGRMNLIFIVFYSATLLLISYIDIKTRKIPNKLVLWILLLSLVHHFIAWDFPKAFAGAVLCFLMFLLVYKANGSKMGLGDVKLGVVLGFVFGYPNVVLFLLGTGVLSLSGALWKKSAMPFAPLMAAGTIIALLLTA